MQSEPSFGCALDDDRLALPIRHPKRSAELVRRIDRTANLLRFNHDLGGGYPANLREETAFGDSCLGEGLGRCDLGETPADLLATGKHRICAAALADDRSERR